MVKYSNPQRFTILNENGEGITTTAPTDETAKAWKADKKVYQDPETKAWTATPKSSVKLGDDGKIHVTVPKAYLNDKEHLGAILDADSMDYLSALYNENNDAKVTMADGTEKKVTDLVAEYDKAIKDYDKAMVGLQTTKTSLRGEGKGELADKLTLDDYQVMGANGLSSKGTTADDSWLAIPNAILNDKRWSFLKDLDSFDAEKQMVKAKEFIEKYYHLDAGRDLFGGSGLSAIKEAAAKAYSQAGAQDPDDWARANAFVSFLNNVNATGDYWNQLAETSVAVGEGVARATAVVVPGAINALWNMGAWAVSYLNPLQVYNIGGGSNYNPDATYNFLADPVDNIANLVGGTLGIGYLVPEDQHFDQILSDQYAERTQFYQATNASAASAFTIAYIGASVTEGFVLGKAEAQLLANTISTISLGSQLRGAASSAAALGEITSEGVSGINVAGNTIPLSTFTNAKNSLSAGVAALTGKANPTFIDTVRALVSTNPQAALNGALYLQSQFGAAGQAYRAQASGNMARLYQYYTTTRAQMEAAGMTKEAIEATEFFANTMKEAEAIQKVFATANQWYATSTATARAFQNTVRIASVMPHLATISNIAFSAASKNPEAVRAILSGTASDEDKEWAIGQIAQNLAAYGIGMLIARGTRAFLNTSTAERANVTLTRGMARIDEAVTDFTNAVKVKMFGNDWRMRTSNPTKKETLMLSQLNQAAQSWVAHAADNLSGVEATEATQAAISGLQKVNNVITDFEPQRGVQRKLEIYHSDAFPAYSEAASTTAKTTVKLSQLLDKYNIETPSQPEALVGGSDATLGMPLDLTRYMSRLLINQQYLNIMGGKDNPAALLKADAQEYEITKQVIAGVESKYPAEITDYIKQSIVPALKAEARELVQIELAEGIGRRARIEGFQETTRFGKNGQDWFPIMRITDAQKSYEEGLRMLSDNKTMGTIAARNLKTDYHYKPGSETMTDFVHPALVLQRRALDIAVRANANSIAELTKEVPTLKRVTKMNGDETDAVHNFNDLQPSFKKGMMQALEGIKENAASNKLLEQTFNERKLQQRVKRAEDKAKSAHAAYDAAMSKEDLPVTKTDKLNAVKSLSDDDIAGLLGDNSVQISVKNADSFDKFWKKADVNTRKVIRNSIQNTSPMTGTVSNFEDYNEAYVTGSLPKDISALSMYRDGDEGVARTVNKWLRAGKPLSKIPEHQAQYVKKLDKLFKQKVSSPDGGGVIVSRGLGEDFYSLSSENRKIVDKGYFSTSVDASVASGIAKRDSNGRGGTVLDIFVPNGTPMAAIPQVPGVEEAEWLFPRNQELYWNEEYIGEDGQKHLRVSLGAPIERWPSAPSHSKVTFDDYQKALKFDANLNANINKSLITKYARDNCK